MNRAQRRKGDFRVTAKEKSLGHLLSPPPLTFTVRSRVEVQLKTLSLLFGKELDMPLQSKLGPQVGMAEGGGQCHLVTE